MLNKISDFISLYLETVVTAAQSMSCTCLHWSVSKKRNHFLPCDTYGADLLEIVFSIRHGVFSCMQPQLRAMQHYGKNLF